MSEQEFAEYAQSVLERYCDYMAVRRMEISQPKPLTCKFCSMKPFSCPGCVNAEEA